MKKRGFVVTIAVCSVVLAGFILVTLLVQAQKQERCEQYRAGIKGLGETAIIQEWCERWNMADKEALQFLHARNKTNDVGLGQYAVEVVETTELPEMTYHLRQYQQALYDYYDVVAYEVVWIKYYHNEEHDEEKETIHFYLARISKESPWLIHGIGWE